jgi:hypothetical protein
MGARHEAREIAQKAQQHRDALVLEEAERVRRAKMITNLEEHQARGLGAF